MRGSSSTAPRPSSRRRQSGNASEREYISVSELTTDLPLIGAWTSRPASRISRISSTECVSNAPRSWNSVVGISVIVMTVASLPRGL